MDRESGRGRERERDPCIGEQVLDRVPEMLMRPARHNNGANDPQEENPGGRDDLWGKLVGAPFAPSPTK